LATEAGADAVVPWQAGRSVARWEDGPRGAKALARWRNTVREAAKQARRSRVPSVSSPVTTVQLAEMVKKSTTSLVLDGSGTAFADVSLPPRGELMVIVGPEGGIADDEVSLLVDAGAQVARLGPTVLRASTAAVVALTAIGVRTERWR
jgi:16S rRNA (uracil1498-N3)-methyltransferase